MARIRPVGTGDPSHSDHHRRHTSHTSHKGHKGHAPRGRHARGKHPRAHQPATPHAPAAEPVQVRSAWSGGAAAPGVISPLLALDPAALSAGPFSDPLTLTGAQQGAIHDPFVAWSRQRDQALNRVARRPGGMIRLAGV